MVITRTPFRVSFFGGGTDYPAWYLRHGGSVLSTSIARYCQLTCRRLPHFFEHSIRVVYSRTETVGTAEEIRHPVVRAVLLERGLRSGIEIHHEGELPARSGMGSSSAFTVGLLHALEALEGRRPSPEWLAREAQRIEQQVLGEAVGSQDQVAAAFGGLNRIDFATDGAFRVTPLRLPAERRLALEMRLLLVYTGVSRLASEIASRQIEALERRARELERLRELVDEGQSVLTGSEPLGRFGRLLDEAWRLKRSLADGVTNPRIDSLYETALRAGAVGGKVLGAGGGGFVLLFVEPERRVRVLEALGESVIVPVSFESSGSRVVLVEPEGSRDSEPEGSRGGEETAA